jgi:hypothetical protein
MTIPTPTSLARNARRTDRRNHGVTTVLAQMRRGAVLRACFVRGKRIWSLSPGREVPADVAALVIAHPKVCGVGDALFDHKLSQTFRFVSR